ncbi:MAG: EamA family transporter, partial [Pseudomonadota bacterium]
MLQKHLASTGFSPAGSTFARFVFAAPVVALVALSYGAASDQMRPAMPAPFWGFALLGALCQVLATMCVVAVFAHRNFAVGMTFKKTEAMLAAVVGVILLGDPLSWVGGAALAIGFVGLVLLSDPPDATGPLVRRVFNRAAGLGLASGVFFAFSANSYRGASLALDSGDAFLRAATTLAIVTAVQTVGLGAWLIWREPGQVSRVLSHWRVTAMVGVTSLTGSLCWFTAYTLQTAAYVNAVGQVELVFSYL